MASSRTHETTSLRLMLQAGPGSTPEKTPSHLGPYRVVREVASGGMGRVFEAWDEKLRRKVAVKLIRPERLESPRALERFEREAQIVARFDHPNIVRVHHFFRWRGLQAIAMEYLEGSTLRARIAHGPLPVVEVVDYARQISAGLAVAHGAGFIHRDLKSDNVMVTPDGRAKILDFGLAKNVELAPGQDATLSREGAVLGTPHTMAPEQSAGESVDHRTDLFAFGILLYELTTGTSPFLGETLRETIAKLLTVQQQPSQKLNPEVPKQLSKLIDHLLAKEPRDRPDDILEVLAEFEQIAEEMIHLPIETSQDPDPGPSRRPGSEDSSVRTALARIDALHDEKTREETRSATPIPSRSDLEPLSQSTITVILLFLSLIVGTLLVGTLVRPPGAASTAGSASNVARTAAIDSFEPCRVEEVILDLAGGPLPWVRFCPSDGAEAEVRGLQPFYLTLESLPLEYSTLKPTGHQRRIGVGDATLGPRAATRVTRSDAIEFCHRLGATLPTAAQWHYARESAVAGLVFSSEEWLMEAEPETPGDLRPFRCASESLDSGRPPSENEQP